MGETTEYGFRNESSTQHEIDLNKVFDKIKKDDVKEDLSKKEMEAETIDIIKGMYVKTDYIVGIQNEKSKFGIKEGMKQLLFPDKFRDKTNRYSSKTGKYKLGANRTFYIFGNKYTLQN